MAVKVENWQLKIAKVIDNEDPDELSSVKVRILPEMEDFKEDHLPWASPLLLGSGASADMGSHRPPEKNSFIVVLILDIYYEHIYYVSDASLEGFAAYQNWASIESALADTGTHSYPNPRFNLTEDGNCTYHNTETGEMGVYHNSGVYVIIDTDGKLFVYTKDQDTKFYNDNLIFDLKADGTYKIDGEGSIECKTGGQIDINGNFTVDK